MSKQVMSIIYIIDYGLWKSDLQRAKDRDMGPFPIKCLPINAHLTGSIVLSFGCKQSCPEGATL